jgi:hypothetical protein
MFVLEKTKSRFKIRHFVSFVFVLLKVEVLRRMGVVTAPLTMLACGSSSVFSPCCNLTLRMIPVGSDNVMGSQV